jgi:hypothetical protein
MIDHVNEADRAYLGRLGASSKAKAADELRVDFVEALKARARGEEPPPNPRRTKPLVGTALCDPPQRMARAGSCMGDRGPLSLMSDRLTATSM